MSELTVVDKTTEWRRMKILVLDSVSSPITKRVYNMALDEFFGWYAQEPRPGFTKATVSAWRVTLEERGLGSSSIIVRMSAIRKLAVEARAVLREGTSYGWSRRRTGRYGPAPCRSSRIVQSDEHAGQVCRRRFWVQIVRIHFDFSTKLVSTGYLDQDRVLDHKAR
jgi:hypothetical protein